MGRFSLWGKTKVNDYRITRAEMETVIRRNAASAQGTYCRRFALASKDEITRCSKNKIVAAATAPIITDLRRSGTVRSHVTPKIPINMADAKIQVTRKSQEDIAPARAIRLR